MRKTRTSLAKIVMKAKLYPMGRNVSCNWKYRYNNKYIHCPPLGMFHVLIHSLMLTIFLHKVVTINKLLGQCYRL